MKQFDNFGYEFMLAYDASERADEMFGGNYNDWILEPKLDGIRAMVHIDEEVKVVLRGRGANDNLPVVKTDNYPFLKQLLEKPITGVTLDGELVCYGDDEPQYEFMKNDLFKMISINGSLPDRAVELQKRWNVRYIPFDILRVDGKSVTTQGFSKRRKLLEHVCEILGLTPVNQYENRQDVYEWIVVEGGEGVMIKKPTAIYSPTRSNNWLKVKKFEDVVAYFGDEVQPGEGRLSGMIGSVVVYDGNGNKMGFVSGLSDSLRAEMSVVCDGNIKLNPLFSKRQVLIRHNGKTGRGGFRHARVIKISEGEDLERVR